MCDYKRLSDTDKNLGGGRWAGQEEGREVIRTRRTLIKIAASLGGPSVNLASQPGQTPVMDGGENKQMPAMSCYYAGR